MRTNLFFILCCCACICGCTKKSVYYTNNFGEYELVAANFSEKVRLSEYGVASTDILSQLLQYGMISSSENATRVYISLESKFGKYRCVLGVPMTMEWSKYKSSIDAYKGQCGAGWGSVDYSFWYDKDGKLVMDEPYNSYPGVSDPFPLQDISVDMTGDAIYLSARAVFYDIDKESNVEGMMHVTYRRPWK